MRPHSLCVWYSAVHHHCRRKWIENLAHPDRYLITFILRLVAQERSTQSTGSCHNYLDSANKNTIFALRHCASSTLRENIDQNITLQMVLSFLERNFLPQAHLTISETKRGKFMRSCRTHLCSCLGFEGNKKLYNSLNIRRKGPKTAVRSYLVNANKEILAPSSCLNAAPVFAWPPPAKAMGTRRALFHAGRYLLRSSDAIPTPAPKPVTTAVVGTTSSCTSVSGGGGSGGFG